MMFKKDEELVDLCGPMNLWEEYVIGEFSGWDMFQNQVRNFVTKPGNEYFSLFFTCF